jgi:hypothetical protein
VSVADIATASTSILVMERAQERKLEGEQVRPGHRLSDSMVPHDCRSNVRYISRKLTYSCAELMSRVRYSDMIYEGAPATIWIKIDDFGQASSLKSTPGEKNTDPQLVILSSTT